MKSRKYSVYNALMLALRKSGIKQHGGIATLLLEMFLEDGGKLYANKVIARKLCKEGQFKGWRDSIVKEGWLEFDYTTALKNKNFTSHRPGKKLLKYVNKEIQNSRQVATFDEVLQVQSKLEILDGSKVDKNEVAELRSEVREMKASLEAIYKAFN